ncbi:MAG: HAMP domain-containing sensor histidine kinase [Actinomycetota bacterium]|nr:HAMP domain-containing sensor histidine kinase [Actinomycetota bacterium]
MNFAKKFLSKQIEKSLGVPAIDDPQKSLKSRSTLKAKLVITVALLVAAGLAVADLTTYTALRSFLIGKLDQQLQTTIGATAQALIDSFQGRQNPGPSAIVPNGSWGEIVNGSHVVFTVAFVEANTKQGPEPKIIFPTKSTAGNIAIGVPTSVPAVGDHHQEFRVLAENLGSSPNSFVILALPENDLQATLARLALVTTLVSLILLILIISLGTYLIGLGLSPLDRMTETAVQISEGDLSRRIEATSRDTEVEKLANALNYMLSTIEDEIGRRQESEARLKRFVADASHELRTPLTSIRGYAELIETGLIVNHDDMLLAASRIGRESERMAGLVEDLLLLARLDQARELAKSDVDFSKVVSDVVADAKVVEPERPIVVHIEPNLHVIGDMPRLTQVVANLMSNLRSHTYPDTKATVTLQNHANDDKMIILSVADEGPGLTKEQLDHVFERFYRADPSRTRAAGGAGLGLSLVASIVAAHAGRSWIASDGPGKGVTVFVELPLARSEAVEVQQMVESDATIL